MKKIQLMGMFFLLSAPCFAQWDSCGWGNATDEECRKILLNEQIKIVEKHWWYDPAVKPSEEFFSNVVEKTGGSLEKIVAGQTAHQAGDVLEGVFYLLTFRPVSAFDHLANGLNPLGLVNSVISDIGGCFESPFCERGFQRKGLKVGIQNISQMFDDELFHWVLPATAPLNPGRHIGIHSEATGQVHNWGGELNMSKPVYTEAVFDSRFQSEFMAMERLHCSVSKFKDILKMNRDYYLLGYNCAGFVEDVLEASGMNSPFYANCGIGQELRTAGPSQETQDKIKNDCTSFVDQVPELLKKIESGTTMSLQDWDSSETWKPSPILYLHLLGAALRAQNVSNLAWIKALSQPQGIYEITGAKTDVKEIIRQLQKTLADMDLKQDVEKTQSSIEQFKKKLPDNKTEWAPSEFAKNQLPDFLWGLRSEDIPLMHYLSNGAHRVTEYFCFNWRDTGLSGFEFCEKFYQASINYKNSVVPSMDSHWLIYMLDSVEKHLDSLNANKEFFPIEMRRFLKRMNFNNLAKIGLADEKIKELWKLLSFDKALEMMAGDEKSQKLVKLAMRLGVGNTSFETTAVLPSNFSELLKIKKRLSSSDKELKMWATIIWVSPYFKMTFLMNAHKLDNAFKRRMIKFYSLFGIDGIAELTQLLFGDHFVKTELLLSWITHEFEVETDATELRNYLSLFRGLKDLDPAFDTWKKNCILKIQNKIEYLNSKDQSILAQEFVLLSNL